VIKLRYVLSIGWLLLLVGYILAGVPVTPFHGDEAMQITMSADYDTAFLQGNPAALTVSPPYPLDSPAWLRLINGSVNRYLIGLVWHAGGYPASDLPTIWQWPLSYDENIAQGHRPPEGLLTLARWPSALLLVASVGVMFALGWRVGGFPAALLASGVYALHPVILINGRRAMQEGALLCFGLLCICLAMHIAQRLTERGRVAPAWWMGLALGAGLTLASKHSGIVFVAAAFGWVGLAIIRQILFTAERQRGRAAEGQSSGQLLQVPKRGAEDIPSSFVESKCHLIFLHRFAAALLLCCFALTSSLVIFIALSPALWNDPPARLRDLLTERAALLESQVIAAGGPTPFTARLSGILTQPFLQPAEIYEAGFWANSAAFLAEVGAYQASPWRGIGGLLPGLALSALMLLGLGVLLRRLIVADRTQRVMSAGLLVWLLVSLVSLLVNPLPWQRYYLPLVPVAILLAAVGAGWLTEAGRGRISR
jgi:hypothetical protein